MKLNYRKNIIAKLQKDDWEKISSRLKQLINTLQLKDENQIQKINQYIIALQYLHHIRIDSAGFQALGGGYCGEVSSDVSYNMLRVFHARNIDIPSIIQVTLNEVERDNNGRPVQPINVIDAHAISVIGAVSRNPGERFFDYTNPKHMQGFLCDPWFHQFDSFMQLEQLPEHKGFNPLYITQASIEIGQFPDISGIPEELKSCLEQLRLDLINHPYVISDSDTLAIQAVRFELDYIANYDFESASDWMPRL